MIDLTTNYDEPNDFMADMLNDVSLETFGVTYEELTPEDQKYVAKYTAEIHKELVNDIIQNKWIH